MSLTDSISTDYRSYACNVYVGGTLLPSYYQVISVQVKQGFQHISSAEILLKQDVGFYQPTVPDPSVKKPVAGELLSVKANLNGNEVVLFDGVIVKHSYRNSPGGTRLKLVAKDKVVNLSLIRKTETFSGVSDQEVIDTLARNSGFTVSQSPNITTQLSTRHTQLVKHGISDWDYINLRAEACGCFVFTGNGALNLDRPTVDVNPLGVITATYGSNVYELHLEQEERSNSMEYEIISYDTSSLEAVSETEEQSFPQAGNNYVKGRQVLENYRTFNNQESVQILDSLTTLKKNSKTGGTVHLFARLDAKPGNTLKLEGFNDLVNREYVISSVLHDYSEGGFNTWLQFGLNHESYACRYDLHRTGNAAPLIVSGVVTKLESDPDNLYRIQVRIPVWKNAQEPLWARLSTLYAGDGRGWMVLPETGDEVIVAFTGNDYDSPVVLGSTFNPKTPPGQNPSDDNHEKSFITRKGMKWSWNDDKGEHEISTPAGNKILISEDARSILVEDQSQNKIEMTGDSITVSGKLDVIIKAGKDVKIEGVNVEIQATGMSKIKGSVVQIN